MKYEKFYHTLIELKKNNKALLCGDHGGELQVIPYEAVNDTSKEKMIFPFVREKDGDKVFAIFNFSDKEHEVKIESNKIEGDYRNLISGENVSFNNIADLVLKPWGYEIYVK